jgi:2-methylisocitrate lyase-like PEP mutase family enzyme
VERVAAAVEAARHAPAGFVLTARAENFLYGRPDLDDTIRRLQAFEKAGADVLYAPGLPDFDAIRTVCAAVTKPVNILANVRIPNLSVAALAELGAKRISLGGTLSRTILGSLVRAARELHDHGTFGFAQDALPIAEINAFMRPA